MNAVVEFRSRVPAGKPHEVFGLEVASELINAVGDSVFSALDHLRRVVDSLEEEVLEREWVWRRHERSALDRRLTGLRRMLRRVRWAYMPADEVDELSSGPFMDLRENDPGLNFRLTDLGREANRAKESIQDVLARFRMLCHCGTVSITIA